MVKAEAAEWTGSQTEKRGNGDERAKKGKAYKTPFVAPVPP